MAKIFLCGQRAFGAAVLKALLARGHQVTGIACPPQSGKYYDKLKVAALPQAIPCVDSSRLRSTDVPDGTEILIAAHAHHFISGAVRSRVGLACGYHPSLLPRHRGRDAVRWAVHCGDTVTGGTVYELGEVVDGGAILAQEPVLIPPGVSVSDLWRTSLFPLGIELLIRVVQEYVNGTLKRRVQDEKLATWEPSFDSSARLHRPDLLRLPEY